jgi:hypothetical protein
LGNLSHLVHIGLYNNQFSGSIPAELGNLSNLGSLSLSGNQLTGSIPVELGNLTNLRYLSLDDNQLTGSIPAELGNLSNLLKLILNDNQLTGSIPAELGNPGNLEFLLLDTNRLDGSIPAELGNLVNMKWLRLNGNQLTGDIPSSLTNLTNLFQNNTDFGYNGLYTADETLRTFLNDKDPGWEDTQTIAPTGISAVSLSGSSVEVSWTPILYTAHNGGYRVFYSTTAGGPYTLFDITAYKTVSSMTVTGLTPNTTYYFVVQTRTESHSFNQNTIDSEYSEEVSVETIPNPSITLTSPNGGENWGAGSAQNITWASVDMDDIENVIIEYSIDNGATWTVIAHPANAGSYNWTVPVNSSDNCLVRVRGGDSDDSPADVSDAVFSISSSTLPSITVTSPRGRESWEVGSIHSITWTSTGAVENVIIEYSIDNGTTWTIIAPENPNDGSYNWAVPNTPSNNCLVRVSGSDSDEAPSGVSGSVFSIVPATSPKLVVTFPNGGEKLTVSSSVDITWTSIGTIDNVTIEYSPDSGATWTVIETSIANEGSYNWTVPDNPSDECLVRVGEISGEPVDISDAVFSMVSPSSASITITSPNGGETLTAGAAHDITWTSTGTINDVIIEFSIDNGATWTIIAHTTNEGSYNWTVTDTPSDNCLVRIKGNDSDNGPSDVSDAVFSIIP